MRARPIFTALCLAFGLWSCSRESPPEEAGAAPAETTASTPAEAESPDTTRADTAQAVGPAASLSVAYAGWFPHRPHREAKVACRTCHTSVPGHATHAAMECRQCHLPPSPESEPSLTRTECMSCHHGATQTLSCTTCHDPLPGPLSVERDIKLSVWPTARTRSFTFPHEPHDTLGCETCHNEPPLLTPTRTCGSCHDRHHQRNADCSTCHQEPPPSVHDDRVHLSCSGSGCHAKERVAFVPSVTQTRAACLVCHRDRVDHEPKQVCATCHLVRLGS